MTSPLSLREQIKQRADCEPIEPELVLDVMLQSARLTLDAVEAEIRRYVHPSLDSVIQSLRAQLTVSPSQMPHLTEQEKQDWRDCHEAQAEAGDPAVPASPVPQACEWVLEEEDYSLYRTTCGHSFEFNVDGPVENGLKFCGYCGRQLEVPSPPAEPTP